MRTAKHVIADIVKQAEENSWLGGLWDSAKQMVSDPAKLLEPSGMDINAQGKFTEAAKTLAGDAASLQPMANKIKSNPNVQQGLNEGVQTRARNLPIVGGAF
jgi:hypothetical protein